MTEEVYRSIWREWKSERRKHLIVTIKMICRLNETNEYTSIQYMHYVYMYMTCLSHSISIPTQEIHIYMTFLLIVCITSNANKFHSYYRLYFFLKDLYLLRSSGWVWASSTRSELSTMVFMWSSMAWPPFLISTRTRLWPFTENMEIHFYPENCLTA